LDIDRIVSELKKERDRIARAIAALEAVGSQGAARKSSGPRQVARRKRGGITPEGRKRLSEAMKRRWAERRRKSR